MVRREIDLQGRIEDPHGVVEIDGLVVVSDRAGDRWISLDRGGRQVATGGETGADAGFGTTGLASLPGGRPRWSIVGTTGQGYDPRTDWAVTFSLGQARHPSHQSRGFRTHAGRAGEDVEETP